MFAFLLDSWHIEFRALAGVPPCYFPPGVSPMPQARLILFTLILALLSSVFLVLFGIAVSCGRVPVKAVAATP